MSTVECTQTNLIIAQCVDLTAIRGDNLIFTATFTQDGSDFDLTIYTGIRMQIKRKATDTTAEVEASLGNGLTVVNQNQLQVNIPGTDMEIDSRRYVYDVEGSNADPLVQTILKGTLDILDDVTR